MDPPGGPARRLRTAYGTHGDRDANPDPNADADPHADSDPDPDSDAHSDIDADGYADAVAADRHSNAIPDPTAAHTRRRAALMDAGATADAAVPGRSFSARCVSHVRRRLGLR